MNNDLEKLCPYAPYTSVLTVIRQMRDRGLKEPVTSQSITTIGVTEGNASRTIAALHFLNLLDEEGFVTPNFKVIGDAPDNEYPEMVAQTLRDAYKNVFMTLDPATASDQQFDNAFRFYQPKAQRSRMIMLFKGLCREASLMPGGSPEKIKRPRSSSAKSPSASQTNVKAQPKFELPFPQGSYDNTSTVSNHHISNQELAFVQGLINQLPIDTKKWTQARRDKWLLAVESYVDLLIEIEDPTYKEQA